MIAEHARCLKLFRRRAAQNWRTAKRRANYFKKELFEVLR
jgi:hypothetical protein